MNILIVSGFLGAGKTTFIKELSKRSQKEIAILENEFADTGIDGDILRKQVDPSVKVWELAEGCICCSSKGDFVQSVLTIANSLDPDYLVIEPTGVAKLGNILENLKSIIYERIQILSPITIVDAFSIIRYKEEFPDIYRSQIESAGTILLSKTEKSTPEEIRQSIKELQAINSRADIPAVHYGSLDSLWWEELLLKRFDGTVIHRENDILSADIETLTLHDVAPRSLEDFILFLEQVIRGEYGNILRAKGMLSVKKLFFRFDLADGRYSILLQDEEEGNEISRTAVFIGNRMKRQEIRSILFKQSAYIKIQR